MKSKIEYEILEGRKDELSKELNELLDCAANNPEEKLEILWDTFGAANIDSKDNTLYTVVVKWELLN